MSAEDETVIGGSIARLVSPPAPPEKWTGGEWHYSSSPKPCACGNRELELIETVPAMMNYPRRVSVRCPKCGAIGEDTCHGQEHACRRWNWYGDQRTTLGNTEESRENRP